MPDDPPQSLIGDPHLPRCSQHRHLAGQHQRRLLKQQGKAAALPRPGYPHPLDAVLRTIGPRYPGRDIAVVLEEIQMTPAKLAKIMRFAGPSAFTACEGRSTVGFQVQVQLMWRLARSEEHTSELQSLMRISYAVFCLK